MTTPSISRGRLIAWSAGVGFVAGAITVAVLVVIGERRGIPASGSAATPPAGQVQPSEPMNPPAVSLPPVPSPDAGPVIHGDATSDLRQRNLEMPVLGTDRATLHDTFDEMRGSSRRHEAIDILAPLNTPVVAVENGTVAKLFLSDAGGITVYLFDPSSTYVYYYAHLDHYAPGLVEGKRVNRGDVLGFVGVSGNAPKDTPHLHFAIFKLTSERKWWQGTPIDPYDVLK